MTTVPKSSRISLHGKRVIRDCGGYVEIILTVPEESHLTAVLTYVVPVQPGLGMVFPFSS